MVIEMLTEEEIATVGREARSILVAPDGFASVEARSLAAKVERLLAEREADRAEIARLRAQHIETVRDAGRHLLEVSGGLLAAGAQIEAERRAAVAELEEARAEAARLRGDRQVIVAPPRLHTLAASAANRADAMGCSWSTQGGGMPSIDDVTQALCRAAAEAHALAGDARRKALEGLVARALFALLLATPDGEDRGEREPSR